MSDSNGFVYDPEGIDLDLVKDIKEVRRGRIKEYVEKDQMQHTHQTHVHGLLHAILLFHVPLKTNLI